MAAVIPLILAGVVMGALAEREVLAPANQEAAVAQVIERNKPDFDNGVRRVYACSKEQNERMWAAANSAAASTYLECARTDETVPLSDMDKAGYTAGVQAMTRPRE